MLNIIKKYNEKIQESSRERYQNLTEEVKTENENMVVNDVKISQKVKSKGYLSKENNVMKCKKVKICYKIKFNFFLKT